jgi:hypothetical protein
VVWSSRRNGLSLIRYADSANGGKSFSKSRTVAGAGLTGARGWHALTLGYDGGVHVVWLDSRSAQPGRGTRSHHRSTSRIAAEALWQDLYHAAWKQDGIQSERAVAASVCFCCKTAVATSGDRVYAAWRHIYHGGIRDVAVSRSTDNGASFGAPIRVSRDDWKLDECPDDGPAMAADGHGGIHIVWPTLVTSRKAIFYSRYIEDAGFAPRLRLDAGDTEPGHPQVASDEHGASAVVWDEGAGGVRRIALRVVSGDTAAPPEYFEDPGVSYPAVAAADGYWIVLWTAQRADDRPIIEGRRIPF